MKTSTAHAIKKLSVASALLTSLVMLPGCSTKAPEGVTVVTPFNVQRYAGKWYEIARLDHSFERGLTDISAQYKIQSDGSVEVTNRGFDTQRNDWKQAIGRAVFTGNTDVASLKVSFFGPFYGGYHVIALDQTNYRWAMIIGPDRDYLWILARDKQLPANIQAELVQQAKLIGINTSKLIWVSHQRTDN